MTVVPGQLRREVEAFKQRYGVDIRKLPLKALRLLTQDGMSIGQLVYVADEISKLELAEFKKRGKR